MGGVIAVAACFPAVMRIDMIASYAALLVPPVGAICLVEHWLFPRLGLVRHWNLYRVRKINPAALAAWALASVFAIAGVFGGWMHPFFLPVPTFLLAGAAYLLLAAAMGAGRPVPADVRADVDAVEVRIAELSGAVPFFRPIGRPRTAAFLCTRSLSIVCLVALVALAVAAPSRFGPCAAIATFFYFVFTGLGALLEGSVQLRGK